LIKIGSPGENAKNIKIILVSETHLSQDIDSEDIQLRGFQNPIRVDRNRHGGGVAIFAKPNIYILYICEKPEFHTSEIEIPGYCFRISANMTHLNVGVYK
jgi:hypothetical protein